MGLIVMTAFVYGLHTSRRINRIQVNALLQKLYGKDRLQAGNYLNNIKQSNPSIYNKYLKEENEKYKF